MRLCLCLCVYDYVKCVNSQNKVNVLFSSTSIGWAFGVLEFGESGIFQLANVVPLTPQQIQSYQLKHQRNLNHFLQQQMVCFKKIIINWLM